MFRVIFTSDYEIHVNKGIGSPLDLMVLPTYRNMDLFEKYGAKLTIMAEVAELLKYKEYKEKYNVDKFYYNDIAKQLKAAINRGHDVQLHLHPNYFYARNENGVWLYDLNSYVLKDQTYQSLFTMIKKAKDYLTILLTEVKKEYKCIAFRAGGWQMQPSINITRALIDNEVYIDSSLFKNGRRDGVNSFDYSSAHHHLLPWPINENEICQLDLNGKIIEIPIYTEQRSLLSFISLNRFYRLGVDVKNKSHHSGKRKNLLQKFYSLFKRYPLKMDYNQCTGRQLIQGLLNAEKDYGNLEFNIPFVLIGHSKTFTRYNEKILIPFLKFVADNPERFKFSLFSEVDLTKIKSLWEK